MPRSFLIRKLAVTEDQRANSTSKWDCFAASTQKTDSSKNQPTPLNLQVGANSTEVPKVFHFHSVELPFNKGRDWSRAETRHPIQIGGAPVEQGTSASQSLTSPSNNVFGNQGLLYVATENGLLLLPNLSTAPPITGGPFSVQLSQLTDQNGHFLVDEKSIFFTASNHITQMDNATNGEPWKEKLQVTPSTNHSNTNFELTQGASHEVANSYTNISTQQGPQEAPLNLSISANSLSHQRPGASSLKEVLNVPAPRSVNPQNQPMHGYECSECGKTYSTSSNLARHRQTHRSVNDQKARKCPHCDKVYVSMPALSMHIRDTQVGM
ncbi:Transcriptional repressor scratch 2 [Holothuria leucospilota]|uniref:Transcriptional repressor scratch 2 n=1 Tax=Holothuria leucospilota TaxID=206669 RepID=A0A9Q1CCC8_HOLLE|nr:Transcriptional repressor scratch 2 [Holothuria leucospilota]